MFLITVLVFLAVAVAGSVVGVRFWVKPKEAIERVTGVSVIPQDEAPIHPSLIFRDGDG